MATRDPFAADAAVDEKSALLSPAPPGLKAETSPTPGPSSLLAAGSLQTPPAEVLEMEDWELAPGRITEVVRGKTPAESKSFHFVISPALCCHFAFHFVAWVLFFKYLFVEFAPSTLCFDHIPFIYAQALFSSFQVGGHKADTLGRGVPTRLCPRNMARLMVSNTSRHQAVEHADLASKQHTTTRAILPCYRSPKDTTECEWGTNSQAANLAPGIIGTA